MKKQLLLFTAILISSISFSQTTFEPIQNIDPNLGMEGYEIEHGDLDGDGDMDIVIATYDYNGGTLLQDYIRWYENDGNGTFSIKPVVSSTIRWVDGLTVADIDGQNGLDIVATSVSQNKLVYFLSDGIGGFGDEVEVNTAPIGAPGSVVAGDFNMDGNIDLAAAVYTDNRTVWYSGDGSGGFTEESDIESGGTAGAYYMNIGDFDGDTDLDVVVGFSNTQSVEIYYNQYIEDGAVSWVKDAVTVSSGHSFLLNIKFADVNNDDAMDVVTVDNLTGEVTWYNKVKNGASTPTLISDETIIDRPAIACVADIDGDNLNDVVVTDFGAADDAIIWFKGAANATPSATPTVIDDNNFQLVDITLADFDGDNDIDIATIGNFSDTVDWYENELITLGTNDFNLNEVSVYPNPAKDVLNFAGLEKDELVTVYNTLGVRVLKTTINSTTSLNISELNSGVYVLNLEDTNTVIRFVKQ